MFIILSIYSKNVNSLTNFLKFFYKLKLNKVLKLKFHIIQSQKKNLFSFFSTLQSPHVNKKSQEQFEYRIRNKRLRMHVSQITKFLVIWKMAKTMLFSDIKIEIKFFVCNKPFEFLLLNKINYDKFKLKFGNKKKCTFNNKKIIVCSNTLAHTSLKLLDIQGEVLLKNFF